MLPSDQEERMMGVLQLVVVVLAEVTLGSPQLIGHRGVITLREGQVG